MTYAEHKAYSEKWNRIRLRVCTFPDCENKSARGWTTCKKHYSAGIRVSHWKQAAIAKAEGR